MNNFSAQLKEKSVTKHGNNKELIPTFSLYEIYQYSDPMLKHLPKDALKTIERTHLYGKQPVYYNVTIDRRIHNGEGIPTTGMKANQIDEIEKKLCQGPKYSRKFKEQLKNEHVY